METTKFKRSKKIALDLAVGDNIKVGGDLYTVVKMESIFHYTPDSDIRLSLTMYGSQPSSKIEKAILFLPRMKSVQVWK